MARSITRYTGAAPTSTTIYTVPANKIAKIKFVTGLSGLSATAPENKLTEAGTGTTSYVRVNKDGKTYTLISAKESTVNGVAYVLPGTTGLGYITMRSDTGGTPSDVEIEDNIVLFAGDYIHCVIADGVFNYDFYVIEEDV